MYKKIVFFSFLFVAIINVISFEVTDISKNDLRLIFKESIAFEESGGEGYDCWDWDTSKEEACWMGASRDYWYKDDYYVQCAPGGTFLFDMTCHQYDYVNCDGISDYGGDCW